MIETSGNAVQQSLTECIATRPADKARKEMPTKSKYTTAADFEAQLYNKYPALLDLLLSDKTTGSNIFWATDSYESRGDEYKADQPLLKELIIRERTAPTPQIRKSKRRAAGTNPQKGGGLYSWMDLRESDRQTG